MIGIWGGGSEIRRIYTFRKKDKDAYRLGHNDWNPKIGDLCICVEHSGDYFYNYAAIRPDDSGKHRVVGEFGAYCFGKPGKKLTKTVFHTLLAGIPCYLSYKGDE